MRPLALHSPPALHVHRREADGIVVFEARGSVDLFTAPALRMGLRAAAREATGPVLVDLSAVDFIDSTGVAALVQGQRALGGRQRFAVACAPDGPVGRLLDRIRADRIFEVYDRIDDAFLAVR
jgi:anti-sigma B factor antagonist